ncbi:MAG: methyltransferase domain-containing protein [Clostridium sp.]|uniref:methyltransferase domain-containing protein n=1 Tax=Clostridium sp. TaxID=1506 RepID=UPI003F2F6929
MFDEFNYKEYWESIYKRGGTSGPGSYGEIAEYKAQIVNEFLEENHIQTVIEFGCGDGNQLSLMDYATYIGFDISNTATNICRHRFINDPSKKFYDYNPIQFEAKKYSAQLVVCIDVLYHIIEEDDFKKTIKDIFECADYFVIIHTKLTTEENRIIPSIKDRNIFKYLEEINSFRIKKILKKDNGTGADFIILERI